MPFRAWKCTPTAISGGVDISEVRQMSSQWGSQKLLPVLMSHEVTAYPSAFYLFLTQWIMAILPKGCKPDNFESYNSLKLSFTNIRGLCSNFVERESFPWIKLSWHSCSMWDKLAWLNWFWQFFCDRFSSINSKGFYYSYAWSCNLCEGRTSFCTELISRKLCWFLLLFSSGFTSLSVLVLFPLSITFFVVIYGFWCCLV